ncbi:hypothetical protein EYF80_045377 [Liparis tanakae]|uniref:Uncharacterized protein n=1 Tax=Liparis tanakae TaxID=230148 RepID=A0A4Z2FUG2_9TELE|nr:hypothetical protein EYF80_045377 [Liparis tanakae]
MGSVSRSGHATRGEKEPDTLPPRATAAPGSGAGREHRRASENRKDLLFELEGRIRCADFCRSKTTVLLGIASVKHVDELHSPSAGGSRLRGKLGELPSHRAAKWRQMETNGDEWSIPLGLHAHLSPFQLARY